MQNVLQAFANRASRLAIPRRELCLSAAVAACWLRRSHAAGRVFPADAFVDSVGICTHLASPPYRDRFEQVAALAGSLGVRHLRDDFRPDDDRDRWRALYTRFGIRRHLLVSPATNTVPEMLDYLRTPGAETVSAVEGQNEGDSDWFMSRDEARPDWATAVTAYQKAVFAAVRERYARQALPVVSPTVLDYKPADMRALRAAAPFCDVVAVHSYAQGGQEPETDQPYAALPWYVHEFCDAYKPGAPVMATEAGYHGVVGADGSGVSRMAAAKYLPRLLLHAFSLGLVRTFLYELMNEGDDPADPEQNYGLVTRTGEPKPAYLALQSLLGALADPGTPFAPEPIRVAVAGAPPDLRALTFLKRRGEVYVALWRAVRSWDPETKRDLAVSPASVQVTVSRSFRRGAALLLGSDRGWTGLPRRGEATETAVRDAVTLLRFTP